VSPTARPSIRTALPYLTSKPREEIALERGFLTGVAVFRWACWAWMAIVLALDIEQAPHVEHPVLGVVLVAAALAWTGAATVLVRVGPSMLLDRWALAVELAIAAALIYFDLYVYGPTNQHSQSLGSAWPLAVILTMGVAYAGRAGFIAGLVLGLVRFAGQLSFLTVAPDGSYMNGDSKVAAVGTVVFYAIPGMVAGFIMIKLREAEREIATARAREEVGRTLHDGVLQTLAIVQRRATDEDLVALAREQEHELREFLFGAKPDPTRLFRPATADVGAALRATAADAERKHGLRTQVVLTERTLPVAEAVADALSGAVGEALTNAVKHGGAATATIFVEETDDGELFCSVKDTGTGFDAAAATEGIGITRSMRGRVGDVGGRVEIDGRPGRGTEVRFWVPA
jgi:signal transduction histidine kinase